MTYQGRSTPGSPLPATETQMQFISDLMRNHEIPDEPRQGHDDDPAMLERVMDVLGQKAIWRHEASELIDWLKELLLKPGVKPAARPRRYAPRPGSRSRYAQPAVQPSTRSHKDIAAEALTVARQLAAQPGVKERMRLVEQISFLEQELLK